MKIVPENQDRTVNPGMCRECRESMCTRCRAERDARDPSPLRLALDRAKQARDKAERTTNTAFDEFNTAVAVVDALKKLIAAEERHD